MSDLEINARREREWLEEDTTKAAKVYTEKQKGIISVIAAHEELQGLIQCHT